MIRLGRQALFKNFKTIGPFKLRSAFNALKLYFYKIRNFFFFQNGNEFTVDGNNVKVNDATNVGCGWIQFSVENAEVENRFENFLVCNFGFGQSHVQNCKEPNVEEKIVTYYK